MAFGVDGDPERIRVFLSGSAIPGDRRVHPDLDVLYRRADELREVLDFSKPGIGIRLSRLGVIPRGPVNMESIHSDRDLRSPRLVFRLSLAVSDPGAEDDSDPPGPAWDYPCWVYFILPAERRELYALDASDPSPRVRRVLLDFSPAGQDFQGNLSHLFRAAFFRLVSFQSRESLVEIP